MLQTLELRERLKEFSRLSVAAHRSTAQVDRRQEEGGRGGTSGDDGRQGAREKTGSGKDELQELWKGNSDGAGEGARTVV